MNIVKDSATGEIIRLHCTYDPSLEAEFSDGRKVRGTVQWVSASMLLMQLGYTTIYLAIPILVLKKVDFIDQINHDSLEVLRIARSNPILKIQSPRYVTIYD